MSKNVAVFVDVANLYYSARGQEVDVDYVALLKAATKGRDLIRAYAYSGLDPENENQRKFIDFLGKNGYKVVHKDIRKFGDGRVKANLDIELVVDMFRLSSRMDIAVVVSGDGDFAAAIRALQDEGVRCEVISFRPNTSSDLIAVADEFIDIMKIASIGRGKKESASSREKGMSAPEMPAKEVVPEFGFREASPSVAAAALAAAREGKEPRSSTRGRSGSSRSRSKVAAEEPAAIAAVDGNGSAEAAAAVGEDGRRRRRRRGGRGRGRGRHSEAAAALPEATGEIGWTELDDISQIDELDSTPLTDDSGQEREYTFEEADEATLAELGLLDGGAAAEAPAEVTEKPARRGSSRSRASTKADAKADATEAPATPRSSRSRKAAATADEAAADASAAPAEKPARRTRATKSETAKAGATKSPATRSGKATRKTKASADTTDDAASGGSEPAAKPKRRRSTKATSAAAEDAGSEASSTDADGDGQPQGIWQRFRSARGGTSS